MDSTHMSGKRETPRQRTIVFAVLGASLVIALGSVAPGPPAAAPATGSVTGTVRLLAAARNPPVMLSPYARPRY